MSLEIRQELGRGTQVLVDGNIVGFVREIYLRQDDGHPHIKVVLAKVPEGHPHHNAIKGAAEALGREGVEVKFKGGGPGI
jgi:hypothetical protein